MNTTRLPQLSPEVFDVLKRSMDSNEPIKDLMETTLNLLIEAEFDAKIGAKRYEHTTSRATSEGQKIYRCGYRHRRFDTNCRHIDFKDTSPEKRRVYTVIFEALSKV
ncbi:MAG: transposase [Proteobacteria bacterium]|nr:transposase [Pseudomonadota bacterium]